MRIIALYTEFENIDIFTSTACYGLFKSVILLYLSFYFISPEHSDAQPVNQLQKEHQTESQPKPKDSSNHGYEVKCALFCFSHILNTKKKKGLFSLNIQKVTMSIRQSSVQG